jgi:NAD(P)-dependent dehydrogenase (short-subunit alcohol dehydrogenase family)
MQVESRVALITGAGSGIGLATARLLAAEGARIVVWDVAAERVDATVRELRENGHGASGTALDVSQPEAVHAAVEEAAAEWGRIDIVVNNAGINGVWAPLEEIEPDEWDRTLDVNLKGTFLTTKYAAPYLKRQGGAIVVIASVNGTRMFSNSGATAYSCSKAAQVAFTKMVALEFAKHRVRVNAICPGGVVTNLRENTHLRNVDTVRVPVHYPAGAIPLTGGGRGTPEQVAQLILFLVSDAASHITGTEMWIDGAQSLLQG